MGVLWETYQQVSATRANEQQDQLQESLGDRLVWLEDVVRQQNQVLGMLIQQLEVRFGEDLNGDGRVG